MPSYTPWTWSASHGRHYSYLLADDHRTVLDTIWSGPSPSSPQPSSAVPASRAPVAQPSSQANRRLEPTALARKDAEEDDEDDDDDDDAEDEDSEPAGQSRPGDGRTVGGQEYQAGKIARVDSPAVMSNTLQHQFQSLSLGTSPASHYRRDSHAFSNNFGRPRTSAQRATGPSSAPAYNSIVSKTFGMFQSQPLPTQQGYQQPQSNVNVTDYSGPQTNRSTVASLPPDVQAQIGYLERRYIQTGYTLQEHESLDTRFRRVSKSSHAKFFVLGRVFKMLWTEPAGQTNPGKTRNSTHFSLVWMGEQAFSEVRHFLVVRNKGSFSQCIPIQTYKGRGTTKPGIIASDHGVIHSSIEAPNLIAGENITKYSIRVQPTSNESLDPASRVNYAKAYAVEHNVKVLDIGMVVEGHRYLIESYFNLAMRVG
ncbi:hypothetical protein BKA63DRAFT_503599 [Paraphoma chrysanthemicola]|nr:hypothetical protein BKA63DRAFT_503599 [Paraphoma chrysanthemicola]